MKEDDINIKKIAERSGYAFRGRYHDPELNDSYYEDVYYKNCMVAAYGSPIKYGKGNSSVLIAGSVGFGPFVSIRVYNKRAYSYIKSELRNKFHFKTAEVDGKWATLKKGNVIVDISVDGNAYGFTFTSNRRCFFVNFICQIVCLLFERMCILFYTYSFFDIFR